MHWIFKTMLKHDPELHLLRSDPELHSAEEVDLNRPVICGES